MMEVWDPEDKPTVFSRIKDFIQAHTGGLRTSRVCLYPGILLILIFLLLFMFSCSSFNIARETAKVVDMIFPEKEVMEDKYDPDAIIVTDLESNVEMDETANTIACIKLQPECNLDQQN